MSWPLRLLDEKPIDRQTGDLWKLPISPHMVEDLSPEWRASGRDFAWFVQMPGRWPMCLDQNSTDGTSGWTVSGEAPNLTVTPSINAAGEYHGFITNGVIGDDLEGRKFTS